MFQILSER